MREKQRRALELRQARIDAHPLCVGRVASAIHAMCLWLYNASLSTIRGALCVAVSGLPSTTTCDFGAVCVPGEGLLYLLRRYAYTLRLPGTRCRKRDVCE